MLRMTFDQQSADVHTAIEMTIGHHWNNQNFAHFLLVRRRGWWWWWWRELNKSQR